MFFSLFQQERLLQARQECFNKQLEVLAEPLGALYDKTHKEYAGT